MVKIVITIPDEALHRLQHAKRYSGNQSFEPTPVYEVMQSILQDWGCCHEALEYLEQQHQLEG